jgi:hypothetical protein
LLQGTCVANIGPGIAPRIATAVPPLASNPRTAAAALEEAAQPRGEKFQAEPVGRRVTRLRTQPERLQSEFEIAWMGVH